MGLGSGTHHGWLLSQGGWRQSHAAARSQGTGSRVTKGCARSVPAKTYSSCPITLTVPPPCSQGGRRLQMWVNYNLFWPAASGTFEVSQASFFEAAACQPRLQAAFAKQHYPNPYRALPRRRSAFRRRQRWPSPGTCSRQQHRQVPLICPSAVGSPVFYNCHKTQASPCARLCLRMLRAGKRQTVMPQTSTCDTQVSVPPLDPTVTHKHGWRAHKHLYYHVASKAVMWPTSQGCRGDYSMMLPMQPRHSKC